MDLKIWHYIGITVLVLDIGWIVFYYDYAAVKIYNFQGKIMKPEKEERLKRYHQKEYQCLAYLWIHKKEGEYYLKIPQEIIDNSVTTKYKIVSQSIFHKFRKGEKLHVNFADNYYTLVRLSAEITVKNYIATSHQL